MSKTIKNEIIDFLKTEIISEILASEIFVSLTSVENDLIGCLHPIVARFANHKLHPWGIPFIMLSDESNKYHILDSFLGTELELLLRKEFINKLKGKNLNEICGNLIKNVGEANIPWFIKEVKNNPVKLEGVFEIKGKTINYYALCKGNGIFSKKKLEEILKDVYNSLIEIIENYKVIQNNINQIESPMKENEEQAYSPKWLFNSLVDYALTISLSIMKLKHPLDGFFLSLIKKDNNFEMRYHPRSWQKSALQKLKNDKEGASPFDILKDHSYPPKYYQSGFAMVTGIIQVGSPLIRENNPAQKKTKKNGGEYSKELLEIEKQIWDPNKYKVLYVPLNQSIMNRFLIALRLPVDRKLHPFERDLLEKFSNKVAYRIKIAFAESLLPEEEFLTLKFMLYEEEELPKPLKGDEKAKNVSLFNDFLRNSKAIREMIEAKGKVVAAYNVSHFLKNAVEIMRIDFSVELESELQKVFKNSSTKPELPNQIQNVIDRRFKELHGLTNLINVSARGYFKMEECEEKKATEVISIIENIIKETFESYRKCLNENIQNEIKFNCLAEANNENNWILPKEIFWRAVINEWIKDMIRHWNEKSSIFEDFYFISLVRITNDMLTFSLINQSLKSYFNKNQLKQKKFEPQPASGKGAVQTFFNLLMNKSCEILVLEDFQELKDRLKLLLNNMTPHNNDLCWFVLLAQLEKNRLNIEKKGGKNE